MIAYILRLIRNYAFFRSRPVAPPLNGASHGRALFFSRRTRTFGLGVVNSDQKTLAKKKESRANCQQGRISNTRAVFQEMRFKSMQESTESVRQRLVDCLEADERASSRKVHVLDDITIGENREYLLQVYSWQLVRCEISQAW